MSGTKMQNSEKNRKGRKKKWILAAILLSLFIIFLASAAAVVMGHEQEHVSNAYQKAEKGNGEVVRASVQLKTAICPECGRTYISGGETNTQIRYYNEDNPYQKDMKESDADNKYRGANVDISA